ncbi:MAG: hypothetical protein MK078_06660 [Crocinitomicaceae bacterium]|nr:hypothetical protein [Crocinitomicaceae bacterium]
MQKVKFVLLLTLISMIGCSSDPLLVDVSAVEHEMSFERLDQEMLDVKNVTEMNELNASMIERGGELYEFYVSGMLMSGSVYDDSVANYLMLFRNDPIIEDVFVDIDSTFGNTALLEGEILDLFKHLKYHLPKKPMPNQVIFYNSAFNAGVTSTGTNIGIGLDMYLGENNNIVQRLGFPLYMKAKMDKDYLLIDVAHSWLITNVLPLSKGETFLEEMIYYGKLRYAIEAGLPELEDSRIMRYTQEEFDFCMASEYDFWQYLVDMDWIYTTDMKVKMRFFNEAPETVGIEGSPGRVGQFIGWRMIKNYAELNPDVTFADILFSTPDNKILKAYKPQPNE